MNTIIEINTEALAGEIDCITELASEDVKAALLKYVPAMLKRAPVKITGFDPLNDKATTSVVETINKRELAAIYSLLNFATHEQNIRPETVQARVEAEFHVPHVARIPRDEFQNAVNYLVAMVDYFDEETD